jgi:Predicted transcriptional regulators
MSKEEIAAKLKAARENAGLKQEDVADYLEVTPQKVSSFETGRTRVDVDTLGKLCELYKINVNYILGLDKADTDELTEYLDELHKRPEMKMLFKVAKKASKEDVEKAVKIIEMFKGNSSDGDDI